MRDDIYFDPMTVEWVMAHCDIARLGVQDGESVYVVPVHFGYELDEQQHFHLYFHGNAAGQRARLMQANPHVGVEMESDYQLLPAPQDSAFSARFRSLIGKGTVKELTDAADKVHALTVMMHHYVARMPHPLTEDMVKQVHVWRVDLDEVACKVKNPNENDQQILKQLGHQVDVPDAVSSSSQKADAKEPTD
ncbi:pyridoxamine 5'-phosphate oxidase family protein [Limosilactobacillus mucosae]|uniref:pyridoxamine 5'-phosphate oxidase family protein n=1 Tax=Limosilactobacillus mucosae TaxID=97478 RepID=UPI00233F6883|nr:pyridoxamine 5'-phosphate oxidase family protein [Limosilactobacillus mucosae]MDC2838512.1 pyridoxamine 5'-phosphate oxidase family protein [Limosilactobacillus mucosae]MDC2840750.1 pyridoxamine 5'-phosphate oxidase family protein [Limosilactobacillus mucosae]MDC2845712.1 pyridoxamine 5'-phosphate oxidase family protein [Limosilactobacillus mucosae]